MNSVHADLVEMNISQLPRTGFDATKMLTTDIRPMGSTRNQAKTPILKAIYQQVALGNDDAGCGCT
jgi:hypothetical protein